MAEEMTNIINTTIDDFVNIYCELVGSAIKNGFKMSQVRSTFLWGAPGVGKSQGIEQLASRLRKETGREVVITDIRLLLFNPVDLRGIPSANADKTRAVWLKPQIFDMNDSEDVINILFLDELSAAAPAVQAAAYQLVLDRKIGEHSIPDNTLVFGAGNRVTDNSVAYHMPKALANRFAHFEVINNFAAWKRWAIESDIHPLVIGYLSSAQHCLLETAGKDAVAYPSPRSWQFVSDTLKMLECKENIGKYYPLIASFIGEAAATEFVAWEEEKTGRIKPEDIYNGVVTQVPQKPDEKYLVINALYSVIYAEYMINKHNLKNSTLNLTDENYENIASYIGQMEADFATCFYSRICVLESVYQRFVGTKAFAKWAEANAVTLELILSVRDIRK